MLSNGKSKKYHLLSFNLLKKEAKSIFSRLFTLYAVKFITVFRKIFCPNFKNDLFSSLFVNGKYFFSCNFLMKILY
jgi:hypothetical protein